MLKRTTALSTKGQVIVPADIRRALGWAPGLTLQIPWFPAENRLALAPIRQTRRAMAIPATGALRDVYPLSTDYVRALRDEAERQPWR